MVRSPRPADTSVNGKFDRTTNHFVPPTWYFPQHEQRDLCEADAPDTGPHRRHATRNREVGFIFQSFNLIGDLTVYENVELPLTYRGMQRAERRERVTEALEQVEMAHRAKHLPSQLSGGQQQRVAVARAVAGQPSILLADEPTGNLDSRNGEAVMGLLQALHDEGSTICMVTHDSRYAEHARREIRLFDGKCSPHPTSAAHA